MYERLLILKLLDHHANDEGRATAVEAIRAALADDPDVRELRVGLPADADARRSWDVYARITTEDEATYQRIVARPAYRRLMDEELGPRAIVTKGWGFAIS